MGYRGRLIFPFQADIRQLDTAATAEDPDGAGPLESGYDEDFREPVIVPQTGEQVGISARKEKDQLLLPCQVEPATTEALQQLFSGAAPDTSTILIFHFVDLESRGLVDVDGNPTLRNNDRLEAIYDKTGTKVQAFPNPPGMFATEVRPIGFGIGLGRNLLAVAFSDRMQGVP